MEAEPLFQWLATLGIGGVLAAFMFHFYRKDMRENADRLKEFIDSYKIESTSWKEVVISNTKAMTECTKMTEQVFKFLLETHSLTTPYDSGNRPV